MSFRLRQALTRVEESPWTRNWNHLDPIHKKVWNIKTGPPPHPPPPVRVRDRIRQWNVVPGDRVRIRGETDGSIKEVLGINKYQNLVYLKSPTAEISAEGRPTPPSVSYARCQLYIGDREFPPAPGETSPRVLPVFASRIGCTAPKFVVSLGRFDWERFATQTIPRLGDEHQKTKIAIPWPKPDPPSIPPIEAYDTPEDAVKATTWEPSPVFYPPSTYTKKKDLQDKYLSSIKSLSANRQGTPYDPTSSPPIEYMLRNELSNPHSRSKKQSRARRRRMAVSLTHDRFIKNKLVNLGGRTREEALVEAVWEWKERLRLEHYARKRTQWIMRGGASRVTRRRRRQARKAQRALKKLKNISLQPKPNQVIPNTLSVAH